MFLALRLSIASCYAPLMEGITIVGGTGAVGRELLEILAGRGVAPGRCRLLASPSSAGRTIPYRGDSLPVHEADESTCRSVFAESSVVFLAAGGAVSARLAPIAVECGCVVIDNSSAFRSDPTCPLVVAGVNDAALDGFASPGIIANPNCSTIIAVTAIAPLRKFARVVRITASTYQAISGAGAAAMEELEGQARAWASGDRLPVERSGRQMIFNVFSHDSPVDVDGVNEEERKLERESRRIFADEDLRVSATCVRVPVLRAHAEALHLEFDRAVDPSEARAELQGANGVTVVDDASGTKFPEPIDASGRDEILVGRIRRDAGVPDDRGLAMFVCGDQLRKGAALNAVQIAEILQLI